MREVHAYCLFCETRRCRDIALTIERDCGYRSFSPQIIQRKWVKGTAREDLHDWLPGYIFVYTEEPIWPRFKIRGVIRCLENDELTGKNLEFAEMLYRRNGIMGTVRLAEVGDRCRIADPAWDGMHGIVVKLDRGRKRCCVEFEFDGIRRNVWVGYEIVEAEITARMDEDDVSQEKTED